MNTPQDTTKQFGRGSRPAGAGGYKGGAGGRGGSRGPRTLADRPKPEFDQKILDIRRVTRVVSGGRRMSFSVTMLIGDKKGTIGLGTGKATDTALAITKAVKSAKKNLIKIKTNKNLSIPHEISAKYASSSVSLMPNRERGIVAGSVVRDILTLGGLRDITSKIHSGSKNRLNNARATMKALSIVATKRAPIISSSSENEI